MANDFPTLSYQDNLHLSTLPLQDTSNFDVCIKNLKQSPYPSVLLFYVKISLAALSWIVKVKILLLSWSDFWA